MITAVWLSTGGDEAYQTRVFELVTYSCETARCPDATFRFTGVVIFDFNGQIKFRKIANENGINVS